MGKYKVIAITDGDNTALKAVEKSAEKLDLGIIYESAGNPTASSSFEIKNKIKESTKQPVLVMFDDQGEPGTGKGEQNLLDLISDSEIEILGVLAVASNLKKVKGIKPDFSITQDQEIIREPVNKTGQAEAKGHQILEGDTVDILNKLSETLIVGIGDLGKMEDKDLVAQGAPITTTAILEILKRSELTDGY
ncbi:MAG: stage V sporulation protein AE [Bacillota bacterium]